MKRFLASFLSVFLLAGLLEIGLVSQKAYGGFYEISDAEKAYNEAVNISTSDCELKSSGNYRYNSTQFNDDIYVTISKDDCTSFMLNHYWINHGALYNTWTRLANAIIEDWKNEKSYEITVIGATVGTIQGETRPSRLERLDKFCEFMPPEIKESELLNRLDKCGIISNFSRKDKIEFDIEDIAGAAETMGISQRMLGYAIAYLNGSAKFEENSVHVVIIRN